MNLLKTMMRYVVTVAVTKIQVKYIDFSGVMWYIIIF